MGGPVPVGRSPRAGPLGRRGLRLVGPAQSRLGFFSSRRPFRRPSPGMHTQIRGRAGRSGQHVTFADIRLARRAKSGAKV